MRAGGVVWWARGKTSEGTDGSSVWRRQPCEVNQRERRTRGRERKRERGGPVVERAIQPTQPSNHLAQSVSEPGDVVGSARVVVVSPTTTTPLQDTHTQEKSTVTVLHVWCGRVREGTTANLWPTVAHQLLIRVGWIFFF